MKTYNVTLQLSSTVEDVIQADSDKHAKDLALQNFKNGMYATKKRGEHIADSIIEDADPEPKAKEAKH